MHWLGKKENQEVISKAVHREENIKQMSEQLHKLGRDEGQQALSRIDARKQPTLVAGGLIEWMTRETEKDQDRQRGLRLQV